MSLIFHLEVIALTCELKGEDRSRLRKQEKQEGWGSAVEVQVLPTASGVWAPAVHEKPSCLSLAATGVRISATACRGESGTMSKVDTT